VRLAVQATQGVTGVVEEMHRTIASGPAVLGRPLGPLARVLTAVIYGQIRGVTGLVGSGIDAALSQLEPILGESVPGPAREAVVALLNGVIGDHLDEVGNPLAISMTLRHGGRGLSPERESLRAALPHASDKILVLVHGSCLSDAQWNRRGHDHGAELSRELGYTPIYLRYNTGRHISINGRLLSEQLEPLVSAWPKEVTEVSILGHSMGGLVARSACHTAEIEGHRWRSKLRRLVCLGSPHHGSPLERGGNWIDALLGVSAYSAPLARLGQIRSAGVTDLRFGNVVDDEWKDRGRFAFPTGTRNSLPLPEGVRCFAIAGTTAKAMGQSMPGDGLVPVDSALGRHRVPERALAFPAAHQWIALETSHLDLLSRPEVYGQLRSWFSEQPS
jgi:pimeloyl-ACP methyl ester carboxylesterase